jgi:hypothetical protein
MSEANEDAPRLVCGVCHRPIDDRDMCYEIRYGLNMNGRFEGQEVYMVVHSSCLKE